VRYEDESFEWRIHHGCRDRRADGFVKVHVRAGSDRIVGATVVARYAGEMTSELTLALAGGRGLRTLARTIHPYPTQAEAIKRVAYACSKPAAFGAEIQE
jgi:pyruvate/2-oxoglutarate dehydrogenase complex dihydrolipoamide dehydrogenase (E3) component